MAVAPIGVLDLSVITDGLISMLRTCIAQSPLWNPNNLPANPGPPFQLDVTGLSPEESRDIATCQLSLYLFHVAENRFTRNLELEGRVDPARPVRFSPLGLDLYYLLTAHAKGSYVEEQQAMSVALRCFHDSPVFPLVKPPVYLAVEAESSDELARLWQSFTVPLRLGAIYKVSVALISPEQVVGPPAPNPRFVNIDALATALPLAPGGQAIGTVRRLQYRKPDGLLSDPVDLAPATVPPGQTFWLYFSSPLAVASIHLWLLQQGAPDTDVTAWLQQPIAPGDGLQQFRAVLAVPLAAPPLPGVYQLAVGDVAGPQSNGTPFSIAPRIDVPLSPPILLPAGTTYTLDGQGFVPGGTEVLLDTVALTEGAAAPGFFQVAAGGAQITFQAPLGLPAGRYAVRVRAGRVEADPSWWVQL
jgi:hypothetical protein